MFNKLGVQLYTIRDYLQDPEFADLSFAKLAAMGYTEAHTAGCSIDPKLFADLMAKHGISIIGTHHSWDKILNEVEATIELHKTWGTTNVGIGGMPVPPRTDLVELKKFIADFNRVAEIYAKEGFRLTYHHHNFEFVRIDGKKTIMDLLYEELDPKNTSFVLDTCWVAAGGGDVVEWIEKTRGRLDILHLKDMYLKKEDKYYVPYITEVGNGGLAWDRIMKAAEEAGVKHYVVEQDTHWTGTPFQSLQMSSDFLAKYRK
jgi:sugar phosphate isomerase/epimerase